MNKASVHIEMPSGETFYSKTDAKCFFKAMLARYSNGECLRESDAVNLLALLAYHPKASAKIGVGISHFDVRQNMGTRGFWLTRVDGTATDFSYLKCIDGKPPSSKLLVTGALRYAVHRDIAAFRARLFDRAVDGRVPCAESGELLFMADGHIDHRPPMTFDAIVAAFLAREAKTFADVEVATGEDGQTVARILDLGFIDRFVQYHDSVADLAFVKASINLSLGGRRRTGLAPTPDRAKGKG